ncbi:hypothetical protein H2202_000811 [Exophiala xenobiotica]|nr:hypothetical protein H2202_000811 [Exophiala xenobiotica]
MEAFRQRTPSTVDRIFSSEKFTVGFVRVVELFKGVKVPSSGPAVQCRPKPPATNIQEKSAKPLCINGHRALPLGKASYMLPSMPVPGEHLSSWQNLIRERLVDEIQQHFRTEICQPELIMVADASSRVGPCIVLSVWDESLCDTEDGRRKTVKNANKIVRKFQTIQNCPFPVKLVADKLSLAARCLDPDQSPVATSDTALKDRDTLVGLEISTGTGYDVSFRLGGLIRIGSIVYGLTVAHPFTCPREINTVHSESSQETEDSYISDSTDDSDNEDQLFEPHHPTFAGHLVADHQDRTSSATSESFSDRSAALLLEPRTKILSANVSSQGPISQPFGRLAAYSDSGSHGQFRLGSDWALIRLHDDVSLLPNMYRSTTGRDAVRVEAINTNGLPPNTEVTIIAGTGDQLPGVIGQHDITVSVDGINLTVTQIMLAAPLARGYSGSWVVKDNLFVGCIVTVRKVLPIVYMIPAGTIIEDIAQDLGDPDITIDIGDVAAASSLNSSDSRLDANRNRNTMAFLIDGGDVFADNFDANGVDGPASDQSHPLFPELDEVNEDQGIPAHSVHSEAEHDLSRTSTHDLYADSPMSLGSSRRQQEGSGSSSMAPSVRRVVPQLSRTEETPLLRKISNISSEPEAITKDDSDSMSWSAGRQWSEFAVAYYLSFIVFSASSMTVTTLDEIASSLSITSEVRHQMVFSIFVLGNCSGPQMAKPLSQRFGRWRISLVFISLFALSNIACGFSRSVNQLLCFRLLSGIAGSGQVAIGGAKIVDFFGNLGRRSTALVIYSSSFPLGLGMGPLIGAWITERLSWTWSFWIVSASSCLGLQLILLCGTESNADYISTKSSGALQKSSGSSVRGFARKCVRNLGILSDPIGIMLAIPRGVCFGVLYFMLSTFAGLLRERYHLTNSVSGVCYLAIGGGLWSSRVAFAIWSRWLSRTLKGNDLASPEYLLPVGIAGSITLSAGLILYGWTAEKHKPLAGPIVGLILFSFGYGMTPDLAARYLVGTYGRLASPIMVGTGFLMDLTGFGFPLFARVFIRKCGFEWSSTILASGTFTISTAIYIILWLFGAKLRARSKYALDHGKDLLHKTPAWTTTARRRTGTDPEEGGAEED